VKLPGLSCADCGAPELLSVAPGSGEVRLFNVMLRRPVLVEGWCEACWVRRWGLKAPIRSAGRGQRGGKGSAGCRDTGIGEKPL
jgi:hypothetical protein